MMKTIGLIGGMSWESSLEYYRMINEGVRERLGGLHSAKIVLDSVDFAEIEKMQHEGLWDEAGILLARSAHNLELAGAECVLLCTNTMHKLAQTIQDNIKIPFIHIADPTAERIRSQGIQRIGLLGTRFTMEEEFYKDRLVKQYGLEVLIPGPSERETVHRVIYDELCLGNLRDDSRSSYQQIIQQLVDQGAQGIILGCTEIGLLVKPQDSSVPLFDTTRIHADAAVDWALR
jgi:aspartate racemase